MLLLDVGYVSFDVPVYMCDCEPTQIAIKSNPLVCKSVVMLCVFSPKH